MAIDMATNNKSVVLLSDMIRKYEMKIKKMYSTDDMPQYEIIKGKIMKRYGVTYTPFRRYKNLITEMLKNKIINVIQFETDYNIYPHMTKIASRKMNIFLVNSKNKIDDVNNIDISDPKSFFYKDLGIDCNKTAILFIYPNIHNHFFHNVIKLALLQGIKYFAIISKNAELLLQKDCTLVYYDFNPHPNKVYEHIGLYKTNNFAYAKLSRCARRSKDRTVCTISDMIDKKHGAT
jgi:hypothetical protein